MWDIDGWRRHLWKRERHVRSLSKGETFSKPQFLFCKTFLKVPQILLCKTFFKIPQILFFKTFFKGPEILFCKPFFEVPKTLSSAAKGCDVQRKHNPVRECDGGSLSASALQGETFLSPNEIQRNQKSK